MTYQDKLDAISIDDYFTLAEAFEAGRETALAACSELAQAAIYGIEEQRLGLTGEVVAALHRLLDELSRLSIDN